MADTGIKFAKLTNSNYNDWKCDMQAYLARLGYWRLVSGKETSPKDAEAAENWEIKAEKAAGEIFLSVAQDQKVHIRDIQDDPIAMWKKLETAHVSKKPGARFNAYDDLFTITKKDDESLLDLSGRVADAMSKIKNLRPATFTIAQLDKELEAMALIRALPAQFKHLTSALMLQSELDKDTVLELFRAEELQVVKEEQSLNRAAAAFVPRGRGRGRGGYRGGYRGSGGHTSSGCYNCGDKGHWANECPNPKKSIQANKAQVEAEEIVVESAGCASAFSLDQLNSSFSDIVSWNTDTGATSHMTPHKSWIRNYTPYRVPVKLADNRVVYSEGIGSVVFSPLINGQTARDVEFSRVLHVPDLNNNLLSVLYLTQHKGFHVHIDRNTMRFSQNNTILFTASVSEKNTGYLNGHTVSTHSESVHVVSTLPLNLDLWHKRFFHCNLRDVKKLQKLVMGFKLDSNDAPDPICEPCLAGKMHANPFPSSQTRANEMLGLVHSDLHEIGVVSPGGYRYWITFIDDKCRF